MLNLVTVTKCLLLKQYIHIMGFQNIMFNAKMESQAAQLIPEMISKQEELYDDTIIKIQDFASLIAETINAYGQNLISSKEGDF